MKWGRKGRNDKTLIYNYVSCDLTFVTRDSKSSYKSSDSRMLNSTILIFFLNSDLGNTWSFVGNSFHSFTPALKKDCLFISNIIMVFRPVNSFHRCLFYALLIY